MVRNWLSEYGLILFLLRVLLRNQWLAAAAFAIIFTAAGPTTGRQAIWNLIVFGLLAVLVLRFGLLALAASIITDGLLGAPPSLQTSAWYFGNLALLTVSAIALIVWAFYTSIGGRRAWLFRPGT